MTVIPVVERVAMDSAVAAVMVVAAAVAVVIAVGAQLCVPRVAVITIAQIHAMDHADLIHVLIFRGLEAHAPVVPIHVSQAVVLGRAETAAARVMDVLGRAIHVLEVVPAAAVRVSMDARVALEAVMDAHLVLEHVIQHADLITVLPVAMLTAVLRVQLLAALTRAQHLAMQIAI